VPEYGASGGEGVMVSGGFGVKVRDWASDRGGKGIFWRSRNFLGRWHVLRRCKTVMNPSEAREGKSVAEEISDGPRWSVVDVVSGINLQQGDWVRIRTSAGKEAGR